MIMIFLLLLLSPLLMLSSAVTALSTPRVPRVPSGDALSPADPIAKSDLAIVGCGVLGASLCRQLLSSPEFASRTITGITKSTARHSTIREQVLKDLSAASSERFRLVTMEQALSTNPEGTSVDPVSHSDMSFEDVVFCAPPSGFEDYPRAVREAATALWSGGGAFVFTSSGGVYEGVDGETVDESSPTVDPATNPRNARMLNAEREALARGGCALRLAGLYTLGRGAHNYWLERCQETGVGGRADSLINLLHYDDAASACLAALRAGPAATAGKIFLISDGNPTTRKGICDSARKSTAYSKFSMPPFSGPADGPRGKIYDGSRSNEVLQWKPRYSSFDDFMASH